MVIKNGITPAFFKKPAMDNKYEGLADVWRILEGWERYRNETVPADAPGGQCGEMATLMEILLRMIGIEAEYIHLRPSKDTIQFSTAGHTASYIYNSPIHPECMAYNPTSEMLWFYFIEYGGWQKGEGSVYCNHKFYPMWAEKIIANGNTEKEAVRNTMLALEEKNHEFDSLYVPPTNDYKLQKWLLFREYKVDGRIRIDYERCLKGATVEIPSN